MCTRSTKPVGWVGSLVCILKCGICSAVGRRSACGVVYLVSSASPSVDQKIVIKNGDQEITAGNSVVSALTEASSETRRPVGKVTHSDALGSSMLLQTSPKTTPLAVVSSSSAPVVVASVMQTGQEEPSRGVGVIGSTGGQQSAHQDSVGVGPQSVGVGANARTEQRPGGGGNSTGVVRSRRKRSRSAANQAKLTAATFHNSDWESSDEEELPFLHSSLLPRSAGSSKGSTSSWQSSDSEGGGKPPSSISATPTYLANLSVGTALGDRLSGSEGEGFEFQKGPSWISANSSDSD